LIITRNALKLKTGLKN